MFDSQVILSDRTTVSDSIGNKTEIISNEKTIFAEKSSIGLNAFYTAEQSGMKLTAKYTVRKIEYNNQNYAQILPDFGQTTDDTIYTITRTFEVGKDFIELWLGKEIGNG